MQMLRWPLERTVTNRTSDSNDAPLTCFGKLVTRATQLQPVRMSAALVLRFVGRLKLRLKLRLKRRLKRRLALNLCLLRPTLANAPANAANCPACNRMEDSQRSFEPFPFGRTHSFAALRRLSLRALTWLRSLDATLATIATRSQRLCMRKQKDVCVQTQTQTRLAGEPNLRSVGSNA